MLTFRSDDTELAESASAVATNELTDQEEFCIVKSINHMASGFSYDGVRILKNETGIVNNSPHGDIALTVELQVRYSEGNNTDTAIINDWFHRTLVPMISHNLQTNKATNHLPQCLNDTKINQQPRITNVTFPLQEDESTMIT